MFYVNLLLEINIDIDWIAGKVHKIPPQPPPKPKKRTSTGPLFEDEGEDGTEVWEWLKLVLTALVLWNKFKDDGAQWHTGFTLHKTVDR